MGAGMSERRRWYGVVYVTPELLADPPALKACMHRTEAPPRTRDAVVDGFRVSDGMPPCRPGFTRMLVYGTAIVEDNHEK